MRHKGHQHKGQHHGQGRPFIKKTQELKELVKTNVAQVERNFIEENPLHAEAIKKLNSLKEGAAVEVKKEYMTTHPKFAVRNEWIKTVEGTKSKFLQDHPGFPLPNQGHHGNNKGHGGPFTRKTQEMEELVKIREQQVEKDFIEKNPVHAKAIKQLSSAKESVAAKVTADFMTTHPRFAERTKAIKQQEELMKAQQKAADEVTAKFMQDNPEFAARAAKFGKMHGHHKQKHCGKQKMISESKTSGSDDHYNPVKLGHHHNHDNVQSLGEDFFPADYTV